jgi:hypothetical protein
LKFKEVIQNVTFKNYSKENTMKYITPLNRAKLKIKAKHLAEEARIIRKEEKKHHGMCKWELQNHRKWDVRNEARATQLAIALLSGIPYENIEKNCKDIGKRDWYIAPRIAEMMQKYSNTYIGWKPSKLQESALKLSSNDALRNRKWQDMRRKYFINLVLQWFDGKDPLEEHK